MKIHFSCLWDIQTSFMNNTCSEKPYVSKFCYTCDIFSSLTNRHQTIKPHKELSLVQKLYLDFCVSSRCLIKVQIYWAWCLSCNPSIQNSEEGLRQENYLWFEAGWAISRVTRQAWLEKEKKGGMEEGKAGERKRQKTRSYLKKIITIK